MPLCTCSSCVPASDQVQQYQRKAEEPDPNKQLYGEGMKSKIRDLVAHFEAQRARCPDLRMVMEATHATWEERRKLQREEQRRKEEEAAKKEQEELEEQRRRRAKEEAEQRKADEEIYARIKKEEEVCAAVALQRCSAQDRRHWDSWLLG